MVLSSIRCPSREDRILSAPHPGNAVAVGAADVVSTSVKVVMEVSSITSAVEKVAVVLSVIVVDARTGFSIVSDVWRFELVISEVGPGAYFVKVLGSFTVMILVVTTLMDLSQETEAGYRLGLPRPRLSMSGPIATSRARCLSTKCGCSLFRFGGLPGTLLMGVNPADVLIVVVPAGSVIVVVSTFVLGIVIVWVEVDVTSK